MPTRHGQFNHPQTDTMGDHIKAPAAITNTEHFNSEVSLRRDTVRSHVHTGLARAGCESGPTLIVDAYGDEATAILDRDAEVEEGRLNRIEGLPVVEVVWLDVRHNSGRGRQGQERPVTLIGLRNEFSSGAEVCIATTLIEFTADREGRVCSAGLQRNREHRCGGGLPMCASNRDPAMTIHDCGQGICSAHDPDAAFTSSREFGVGRRNCRGDHHGVHIRYMVCTVPDVDIDTDRRKCRHAS